MTRASVPAAALVVGFLAVVSASPAVAGGVVGTGTAPSCTDAALNTALAGGGLVTFNCGGAAVTIDISHGGGGTGTKTIAADTTIDGGSLITISGGHSVLVFSVNQGITFTVQNLSIANGNSASYGGGGGGIYNSGGAVTVTNSTFSGNRADGGGGAIANGGTLTVTNSTFSNNTSGVNTNSQLGLGGGISNGGTLRVTNSTFSGNSAGYGGGGIYNTGISRGGNLTVTNSTFSGNSAGYGGGGAISSSSRWRATVSKSTFSGNSAAGWGGGIYNGYGTLTVTNSTFSGNSAHEGAGIYNHQFSYTRLKITNTIIANSTSGGNCGGAVGDGGHNIDDGTTCGFTRSPLSNTDANLDLAGLANNGGPTQTIAVESGSPAIGAAKCSPRTDQRGYWRAGTGTPKRCTSGAYEFGSPGCPSKLTACGTLQICTNIQKDIDNCGACGNACTAGQKCSQGTCM